MVTTISELTEEQKEAMAPWAEQWIEKALKCGPADRQKFEAAAEKCYRHSNLEWHNKIIWCGNPQQTVTLGPTLAYLLENNLIKDFTVKDGKLDADTQAQVDQKLENLAQHPALRTYIANNWWKYLGGAWWTGWQAWTSFFRDVCHLELPDDLWERDEDYSQAQQNSGWWWPHTHFITVTEHPEYIHREQVAPSGWGSHQLHCETGPAIGWADGWSLSYWHGTKVPHDLITPGWDYGRILEEKNLEVRRCAIERIGWDRFIREAGLLPIDSCPDPGNPGRMLSLYDIPAKLNPYPEPVRLLHCVNGTPERDGTVREFGLTTPASIGSALSAVAWTYDMTPEMYAKLARRT